MRPVLSVRRTRESCEKRHTNTQFEVNHHDNPLPSLLLPPSHSLAACTRNLVLACKHSRPAACESTQSLTRVISLHVFKRPPNRGRTNAPTCCWAACARRHRRLFCCVCQYLKKIYMKKISSFCSKNEKKRNSEDCYVVPTFFFVLLIQYTHTDSVPIACFFKKKKRNRSKL